MDLARRLFQPTTWILGGAGLFSAGTLIVFSMLGWSLLIAAIVILIIALIVVIVMLVRQIRSARASEEIETTIVRQANRDIEKSRPGQAEEMESLKTDLVQALEALKKSKLGRKGGLARVPLYMLVGPAESGKSTLVERSGLHFPLADRGEDRPRSVRGVGGTRSLQWWLSDEAVLLDMPGRQLTTADFEDNEDWFAFLATLRKQRREKPLNGVIVTVGLDQLAERTEAETDKLARRVRDRVRELVQHLGFVFPTYVVFTRADRVAGFAEFFADLDPASRRQPWGAAIDWQKAKDRNPEALFDAEYDVLMASVSERLLARVGGLPDAGQRARAFAFRPHLEKLREPMRRFLRGLFETNPMEETPLFRGFYLTSVHSGGTALDRVIQPAAQVLGIQGGDAGTPPPTGDGPFFLQELLKRVVFPDAELATITSKEEARRRRRQLVLFSILGALFLTFAVALTTISCVNGRVVERTRQAALQVSQQVNPDRSLITNLGYLEGLRAHAALVDSFSRGGAPWYRRVGYAGDVVRDPAIDLYVQKSYAAVVAPAVRTITNRLGTWLATGDQDFLRLYHYYRAWRLLTDVEHFEREDAPLVAEVMADALSPELAAATAAERDTFPVLMGRQAHFLASHNAVMSRRLNIGYAAGDRELQVRVIERLRQLWSSKPFYDRMVAEVGRVTEPADFGSLAGQTDIFTAGQPVPGTFTREGWEKHVRPRIEWYASHVPNDWAIGTIFEGDRPPLADSLELLYAREYTQQWITFAQRVEAQKAPLTQASIQLKKLLEGDGPLFKLLGGIERNTALGVDATSRMGQVVKDFALARMSESKDGSGPSWWRNVISKLPGQGGPAGSVDPGDSPRQNYIKLLRELQEKVAAAAQPNAPGSAERDLSIPGPENSNPPVPKMVAYGDQLAAGAGGDGAAAVARVLKLPTKIVTGIEPGGFVMRGGGAGGGGQRGSMPKEIADQWTLLVSIPFQRTLAGKYPLSDGGSDAALDDFAEFFKPGGTFWTFYEKNLASYITESGALTSPNAAAYVSEGLETAVQKAYAIREAFFASGPQPSLSFQVRTTQPIPQSPQTLVHWTAFDFNGQSLQYGMGASIWQAMTWPGPTPAAGAEIRANVAGTAVTSGKLAGPWGLFRLLDRGAAATTAEGTEYTFRLGTGASQISISYEFQASSSRLFHRRFLRFAMPAQI